MNGQGGLECLGFGGLSLGLTRSRNLSDGADKTCFIGIAAESRMAEQSVSSKAGTSR